MRSAVDPRFLEQYRRLPVEVRRLAKKNYRLWRRNPRHPGLAYKRLATKAPLWSVRVGLGHRAVGVMAERDLIVWFFIGSHAEYDRLCRQW